MRRTLFRAQRLLTAAALMLSCATSALAQPNDWILPPNIRIEFTSPIATVSQLSGSAAIQSCPNALFQEFPTVVSNPSGIDMVFTSNCGVYDLAGNSISDPSYSVWNNYQNVFAIPGTCKRYYSVQWEDVYGPPHSKKLTVRKIDANYDPYFIKEVGTGSPQDILVDGANHPDDMVAAAPLAADATRKIYFTDYGNMKTFSIGRTGSVGTVSTIAAIPFTYDRRVPMEVSYDGTKILMIGNSVNSPTVGSTLYMYDITTGTFSVVKEYPSNTRVAGFEYVKRTGGDRVFVSYHDFYTGVGGIDFVNVSALGTAYGLFSAGSSPMSTLPANTNQSGFGYTDLEISKDGYLFFAYGNLQGTSAPGKLFSYNVATGAIYTILYNNAQVNVNTYESGWGYIIQKQIDGEKNQGYDLSISSANVNGSTYTSGAPTYMQICNSTALNLNATFAGLPATYGVTVRKGTWNGTAFVWDGGPMGGPSTYSNGAASITRNLTTTYSSLGLGTYDGVIEVTITATNGCNTQSKVMLFNIFHPTFLAEYKARKINNGFSTGKTAVTTIAGINATMPAGSTMAAFKTSIDSKLGWQGASSAGIVDINTDGVYNLKVYEVNTSGNRAQITTTGGTFNSPDVCDITSTGPVTGSYVIFNDATIVFDASNPTASPFLYDDNYDPNAGGADYLKEYYLHYKDNGILSDFDDKIWCVDFTVNSPSGCVVNKKSYFKIATSTILFSENAKLGEESIIEQEGMGGSITIYPNPATNTVHIGYAAAAQQVELSFVDVSGRTVVSRKGTASDNSLIDVSQLTPGIYFYKIKVDGISFEGKITKQ